MEARTRLLKRRKPLSDLTNTDSHALPSSHSSSSTASVVKPSKRHPPSPFSNPALTERKSGSRTRSSNNSTGRRQVSSNPSDLSPVVSTPSRLPHSSLLPGSHDHDVSEPISVVYSRRNASEKSKGKEKAVAVPFSSTPMPKASSSRKQNLEIEVVNRHKAKALTAPCRKKRCTTASKQDVFQHAMPQDFIEKQQAYFKEIDDFELPVEEVESADELD
ncbi:uncharacterized protein LOC114738407 [Neltuma alba]|uniref:uncharacterized protein LOC114738407 n=1 Tax=Neltuma alba TaxID=207710 RepID=UPI0010A45016|nr:uncharacterized protein LOC114738407 [Prosopis alba]